MQSVHQSEGSQTRGATPSVRLAIMTPPLHWRVRSGNVHVAFGPERRSRRLPNECGGPIQCLEIAFSVDLGEEMAVA